MMVEEVFWVSPRGYSGVDTHQRVVEYHRTSKYEPHQGKGECARRKAR